MARVREETLHARHARGHAARPGGHRRGHHRARASCSPGRSRVLAVLPLVFLTEIGFVDRLRRPARHVHRALGARARRSSTARRPRLVAVGAARARGARRPARRPRASRRSRCHRCVGRPHQEGAHAEQDARPGGARSALAGLAAPRRPAPRRRGLTITNRNVLRRRAAGGRSAATRLHRLARPSRLGRRDVGDGRRRTSRGAFSTTFHRAAACPRGLAPRHRATAHRADGANRAQQPRRRRRFRVVRAGLDANYAQALNGPPAQRTTWRFAGFTPGRAIYAHLRSGGRARGHAPLRRRAGCVRHARRAGAARALRPASRPAAGGCRSTSAGAGRPARRRAASSPWPCAAASAPRAEAGDR